MRALIPLPARSSASSACRPSPAAPIRFVMLEDVVGLFLDRLFPGFRGDAAGPVPR